jgi:hypothetical protein
MPFDAPPDPEGERAERAEPGGRAERRRAVRAAIVAGGVTGPRDLVDQLELLGIAAEPDDVRGDLRALGAIRVAGPDGPVLALPAPGSGGGPGGGSGGGGGGGGGAGAPPAERLTAAITSDPDWKLQAVVVAVVLAFVLAGLLTWALA